MTKLFNALLLLCGLILALHLSLTVITERQANPNFRWGTTPEGQAGFRALALNIQQPYVDGGDPVNSALVLNFTDLDAPPTTDSRLSDVFFDFTGQGRAVRTGWIGFGSGFLVADRDGDGQVNDGRKFFGNHTLGGDPLNETGFAALAREDTNHDGLIDAQDDIWPRLRVWRDLYTDGHFRRGPLVTLESLGITALELKPQEVDRSLRGFNFLRFSGAFLKADGTRGQLAEVYFQEQPSQRRFTANPTSAAADKSNIAGSGLVRDLPEAAAQSPALAKLRTHFFYASTRAERRRILDDLLTAWADQSGLAPTLAERSEGRYTLLDDGLGEENRAERERRLHVLEAFSGRYFYLLPDELGPGQDLSPAIHLSGANQRDLTIVYPDQQWNRIDQTYDRLSDQVYNELLKSKLQGDEFWSADLWRDHPEVARGFFDHLLKIDPAGNLTYLLESRTALAEERPSDAALDQYIEEKIQTPDLTAEQRALYEKMKAAQILAEADQAHRAAQVARFKWGAAR